MSVGVPVCVVSLADVDSGILWEDVADDESVFALLLFQVREVLGILYFLVVANPQNPNGLGSYGKKTKIHCQAERNLQLPYLRTRNTNRAIVTYEIISITVLIIYAIPPFLFPNIREEQTCEFDGESHFITVKRREVLQTAEEIGRLVGGLLAVLHHHLRDTNHHESTFVSMREGGGDTMVREQGNVEKV